jgi:hypothetical protein
MSSGQGASLPQAYPSLLSVAIGHLCVFARRSDMEILMPLAMSSHQTLSVPSAGWRIREIPNRASSPKTQVHDASVFYLSTLEVLSWIQLFTQTCSNL